jgi:probable rRNA maturation factor
LTMPGVNSEYSGFFFFSEEIEFKFQREKDMISCLNCMLTDHDSSLGCINVVFCADEYLAQLNKIHLGHDYYTDILSFPMTEDPLSGDLFISIDRVRDNAVKMSSVFYEELSRVIIHGILHLLGYQDDSKEKIKEMSAMEDKYLRFLVRSS